MLDTKEVMVATAGFSILSLCAIFDCIEKARRSLPCLIGSGTVGGGVSVAATLGGFGVFNSTVSAPISTVVLSTVGIGALGCIGGCVAGCVCASCVCKEASHSNSEERELLLPPKSFNMSK